MFMALLLKVPDWQPLPWAFSSEVVEIYHHVTEHMLYICFILNHINLSMCVAYAEHILYLPRNDACGWLIQTFTIFLRLKSNAHELGPRNPLPSGGPGSSGHRSDTFYKAYTEHILSHMMINLYHLGPFSTTSELRPGCSGIGKIIMADVVFCRKWVLRQRCPNGLS